MQKLQSYGTVAVLLLFSQINCAVPVRQIATSGIGFIGGVGVGFAGEKFLGNDKLKKMLPLFSVACALPALVVCNLLEGNRFGKKLQYGASVLAPAVLGVLANYFYMRNTQEWNDDTKDGKGPVLILGFLRGLIYGGSALAIKALADLGANKFVPSNT